VLASASTGRERAWSRSRSAAQVRDWRRRKSPISCSDADVVIGAVEQRDPGFERTCASSSIAPVAVARRRRGARRAASCPSRCAKP
jgi:hypothetical protein